MIHRMVKPSEKERGRNASRGTETSYRGTRLIWLQVLLVICIASASTVRAQTGFISIDCGSNESYNDTTGIYWETDAKYTLTGRNQNITVPAATSNGPILNEGQVGTVRIFDEPRDRDCYVLPVVSGETYLLRATFLYGSNLPDDSPTSFSLTFDNNSINYYSWNPGSDVDETFYDEVIYSASQSTLNVCLIRVQGPTFISALELRLLASEMYATAVGKAMSNQSLFIQTIERDNCGAPQTSDDIWRYPNDPFDRIWTTGIHSSDFERSISNSSSISGSSNSFAQDPDRPPLSVMEDAWVVNNNSSPIEYAFSTGQYGPVYTAAYFQELDSNASATNVRGMEFYLNDNLIQLYNISNAPLEIYTTRDVETQDLNISFTAASWSSLGPILNAFELYGVYSYDTSATAAEDVSAIHALQNMLNSLLDWTGDPCLPASYPFNWLSCSNDVSPRITQLHLSDQGFQGDIPLEILNLTALTNLELNNNSFSGPILDLSSLVHLTKISLQYNFLSGEIPSFFNSAFPNLTELHLENNNLSGLVPQDLLNKIGLEFTFSNNPRLFTSMASVPDKTNIGAVVGGIIGALVALAIVSAIIWMFVTRKRRARAKILKAIEGSENPSQREFTIRIKALSGSLALLTLQGVSNATKKFSKKIGEGAFGPVYYGKLPDGREVAVKVKSADSRQGVDEFFNEVELLSRIHHRNLVSLVGYCEEGNQQILIYVYVSNGTLREHLYGDKPGNRLDWIRRLDIAMNAARGLEYLHMDCQPRIIHRDVKSSNILLDENMVAKVADFGISKQAPEGIFTSVDATLKGTFGYMDPEYFNSHRLTQKSDVYSFGVVLLEIISGRHPYFAELPDGTSGTLIQWVRSAVKYESPMDIVDPSLNGEFNEDSVRTVISLAISCIDPQTAGRPEIGQVVRVLAEAIRLEPSSETFSKSDHRTNGTSAHGNDEEPNDSDINLGSLLPSNDSTIVLPR